MKSETVHSRSGHVLTVKSMMCGFWIQQGSIHRDLKSSNIMATLHEGETVVKVIDFRMSKALRQLLADLLEQFVGANNRGRRKS